MYFNEKINERVRTLGLKQLMLYIFGMLLYIAIVFLLNRHDRTKKGMNILAIIGVVVFSFLKFYGRFNNIEYLRSTEFINSYLMMLSFIMYIPIIVSGYRYTDYYIEKKKIKKPAATVLRIVSVTILFILGFLVLTWWFMAYNLY